MAYFINTIENNKYNNYKYQYLDHIVATINLRQNYWDFNMQLLMINNCSLPLNTLLMHASLPYQEVKNITFNLANDQSKAKELVSHNASYCKIYEEKFSIDVSNNQYLNKDLTNVKLPWELRFEVDQEAIVKAKTDIKQEALDGFVSETEKQRWSWEMYYTNTHLVDNQSKTLSNAYSYNLNDQNLVIPNVRLVDCNLNNYSLNNNSIKELAHFQSTTLFKVEEVKVKFYYWLDLEAEAKTLETVIDVDKSYVYDLPIAFNKKTLFDYVNNKVTLSESGIEGFYIPRYAQGYYQLEVKFSQDNEAVKIVIKNNYSFNHQEEKPHILSSSTTINDLKGYKRLEF